MGRIAEPIGTAINQQITDWKEAVEDYFLAVFLFADWESVALVSPVIKIACVFRHAVCIVFLHNIGMIIGQNFLAWYAQKEQAHIPPKNTAQ